jgi:hypothetical protein
MLSRSRVVFSVVLAMLVVSALVGTARASSGSQATVTPVSGDSIFAVSPVPVEKLPGQTTTTARLIVPSGFPLGEKQFDGDGVAISGLSYGFAKACFPITALNQGWGGKVGYWNGSAWKLLDTSISTPPDATFSWACANVSENGTYALITWVVDASLLPENKFKSCSFLNDYYVYNETYAYDRSDIWLQVPWDVPFGSDVTFTIISVDPEWEGPSLVGVSEDTKVVLNPLNHRAVFIPIANLYMSEVQRPFFTARVTFFDPGCSVDIYFPSFVQPD